MKLAMYKLMYRLTNDRKWLIRYIDELDNQIYNDIIRWRLEHETN